MKSVNIKFSRIQARLAGAAIVVLTAAMAFGLSSCIKDKCESTQTYYVFDPVYVQPQDFRHPIIPEAARTLEEPGKIYYYNGYLLINEYRKGIHVIDDRQADNPVAVSFINIPGNVDMAVRGGLLYADNYTDLVVMNIEDPANPVFAGRTENVFPTLGEDPQLGMLVEYRQREETQTLPCEENGGDIFLFGGGLLVSEAAFDDFSSSNRGNIAGSSSDVGVGGSLARFTIAMDHLYVVDDYQLHVFSLSAPETPLKANTVSLGWGIETIFPYGDKLFIGANSGMHIYDNSNPTEPVFLSTFQHAMACDPVFVDGNLAYVTLRDGNNCQNFTNQLDVVDVTSLTQPKLLASHPMHNPHGLSKWGDALLICENDEGLKIFDASDWSKIGDRLLSQAKGFKAYDVITIGSRQLAIVIGQDGLHQFDISDPTRPAELSRIGVD
ncbi:MAG: hypothetical protein KDC66_11215 [Phaeodactylibacter sp.]|nr:hypothetical protein [Phaeodactylibacter sp.]MCB9274901.1 hypothetical protein [Lewinellaceae bacterium]